MGVVCRRCCHGLVYQLEAKNVSPQKEGEVVVVSIKEQIEIGGRIRYNRMKMKLEFRGSAVFPPFSGDGQAGLKKGYSFGIVSSLEREREREMVVPGGSGLCHWLLDSIALR